VTAIQTACPVCGLVELSSRQITLNVSARMPERSHYCFTCPTCLDRVERPADDRIIALLAGSGIVNKTQWEPPNHPEEPLPVGPPLTEDDLIRFGLQLQQHEDAAMLALPASAAELARWAR
jgi:hypothetical protein